MPGRTVGPRARPARTCSVRLTLSGAPAGVLAVVPAAAGRRAAGGTRERIGGSAHPAAALILWQRSSCGSGVTTRPAAGFRGGFGWARARSRRDPPPRAGWARDDPPGGVRCSSRG
ncbi:exported hypothetical protein [Frankia sp. AgKG'84/4]